jgi:hypothetical protein
MTCTVSAALFPDGMDFKVTDLEAPAPDKIPGFVGLHEPARILVQNPMEMEACLEMRERQKVCTAKFGWGTLNMNLNRASMLRLRLSLS